MTAGLIFGVIGFLCGFGVRLVGVAILLSVALVVYLYVRALSGDGVWELDLEALIGIVAMQVGYAAAIGCRALVRSLRSASTTNESKNPAQAERSSSSLSSGG